MLGPCLSYIRVVFFSLFVLLLLVWLRILLKWYKGPNMYHIYVLDHILAIIWSCLGYFCYIFVGLKECGKCHKVQSNQSNQSGPYDGYVLVISVNIFASRCLKWFKFLLESNAYQIEEYYSMLNFLGPYKGHGWAILGPSVG